jgi:hypothetical protein
MTMDASDLEHMAWSDAELESIAWIEEGRDVVLRLRHAEPATPSRATSTITCRWAAALEMNLAFPKDQGGRALTWSGGFTHLSDDTWAVFFDFGATGAVRLVCAEVEVSIE